MNNNTAFDRSFAVSGGLALLRAFCQGKIEHQVRNCCVKGLVLRNMAGREGDAGHLHESGYKKGMKKKQQEIRIALKLQKKQKKISEYFGCDKLHAP